MRGSTRWGCVAVLFACLLSASCSKRSEPKKAVASATAISSARPGLTDELEQLIKLSKSGLGPDERRKRLKAVLEKFPAEHSKEREELIVQAIDRGAYDPPEWTTITSNYKGRRARIQVSTDALTILGVRVDVTADGAQRIADKLGTVLPTPRILQLIWEQAEVRIEPCNSTPDAKMASTARMIEHSECVDKRIAGRKGMVANEGKHWVLSNRIAGKENLAANYGWFIKGRRPVQTVGTRHDTAHTDYSQIVRLVKPTMKVDGRDVDLRHVGRSPELWGLVSDEGPLLVWRASKSGAEPSPSENTGTAAPPPKPGDPATVRVALKQEGMPVSAEQLPATTTALRRNRLSRRVSAALRMRPEDVPEEAYFSAAAAACGGRDVFFEVMTGVPVELAELKKDQDEIRRALDCGKALAPRVRAGAALYEVEYDYEGLPSGFAMLALPDDSFRDKLLNAPLSPTPAGVHRAYCNDDTEGGARAACQDGARSRLLLAVNGGYVAAYAREVPSLLERLTRSAPPPADLAELVSLFVEPSPAEEVAIARGGACGFAVDFTSVDVSPDETNRQRALDAINDNAVYCGTYSSGSISNASRRLVFVAKDEASAQTIRAALSQRALEVRFESGVPVPKGSAQYEFNEALRATAVRSARAAKIELVGRRLSVTLTLVPNDAEWRGMSKLLDARAAKAKLAAEIVRELAQGKLPTAERLEGATRPPDAGASPRATAPRG
jgi:hypothetical protein